jgi:hypothetical protein
MIYGRGLIIQLSALLLLIGALAIGLTYYIWTPRPATGAAKIIRATFAKAQARAIREQRPLGIRLTPDAARLVHELEWIDGDQKPLADTPRVALPPPFVIDLSTNRKYGHSLPMAPSGFVYFIFHPEGHLRTDSFFGDMKSVLWVRDGEATSPLDGNPRLVAIFPSGFATVIPIDTKGPRGDPYFYLRFVEDES